MKKYLIFIVLILASVCHGAFTTSIDNKTTYKHGYVLTGKPKDIFYDWCQEVEDRIDSTSTAFGTVIYLTPSTAPSSPLEGQIYYDASGDVVKFRNGSSAWVTLASSSASTLDGAYDAGTGITVDNGAVTLTATDAANNTAFAIVQQDTAAATAMTITGSQTTANAIGIDIDSQTTGRDIEGTGASWYVTGAGAVTCVGITNNLGDVLFNDTYDVQWDTSADLMHWLDNAVLGMGGAADGAADVTFKWDASNLLIESAAEDTGEIRYGSTSAIDVAHYGNTNTNIAKFNANTSTLELNGYDLQLQDGDFLAFGDGDDFVIDSSTAKTLDFTPGATTDGTAAILFGADGAGCDLKMFPEDAGDYILFDADGDELYFEDSELVLNEGSTILFRDSGDATDWTIKSATAETLEILPTETTDDQTIKIGSATNTTDIYIYGKETSEGIFWDSSAALWSFGHADNYGVDVRFRGDTASQMAWWDCSGDEWFFGDDAEGVDVTFNGDNTGNYIKWDESLDTMVGVGGHIKMDDDAIIYFGTGTNVTTADGDFTVNFTDGSPGYLTISAAANVDDVLQIGDGTNSTDILIQNTTTAGADVFWDDSGELWKFGADNIGVDVGFYGDTSGDFILFDEDADELVVEDIKINVMDDTLLTFGDADDVTMNYDEDGDNDLQVTGAVTLEGTLTVAGTVQPDQVVTDAAEYDVTAANSGKVHIIGDLAQNSSIDLPAEADGLNYEFWYCATAADAHDHTIDTENNTNYFIGGVLFHDTDDSSITKVASDNNSNSKLTLNNLEVGTRVAITCEGTKWYVSGFVVSDTAPAFADQ